MQKTLTGTAASTQHGESLGMDKEGPFQEGRVRV